VPGRPPLDHRPSLRLPFIRRERRQAGWPAAGSKVNARWTRPRAAPESPAGRRTKGGSPWQARPFTPPPWTV